MTNNKLGNRMDENVKETINLIEGKLKIEDYVMTLDIGKHATKAIGRNMEGTAEDIKRVMFDTNIYDLKNGYVELAGNSYKIEFNGKEYIIGELGEERSTKSSKTELIHKLAAYAAITRYLKPNTNIKNKIHLVLACPLSVLKSQEAKEEYKQFIKGDGVITIVVNGENFAFEIEDIMIKAEGSGILYIEPERFKGKKVAVLDFGGLNFGFSAFTNGVCKNSDRFNEEIGTTELVLMVKDGLTTLNKGNIVKYDIAEKALEAGHMKDLGGIKEGSQEKIREAKEKFLKKALAIIENYKFDLTQFDDLVFVGGTTQKIKEQILKEFPNCYIPANSQWTTADGLYTIACGKYCNKGV